MTLIKVENIQIVWLKGCEIQKITKHYNMTAVELKRVNCLVALTFKTNNTVAIKKRVVTSGKLNIQVMRQ